MEIVNASKWSVMISYKHHPEKNKSATSKVSILEKHLMNRQVHLMLVNPSTAP
jgi:hypothetical protein